MSDIKKNITPIFIFSLPRSGSTLLQRILAKNEYINTISEPWILLPLFYITKNNKCFAEFSCKTANRAIMDFISELPNGEQDFNKFIQEFVIKLYSSVSKKNTKYFLDKTPRYGLIVEDIINTFPNAKFIFLWRNPISVISSIITTWGNGKWNFYNYYIDIYKSYKNLYVASVKYKDKSLEIYYEELIQEPEKILLKISQYLNINLENRVLKEFYSIKLSGKVGDKIGYKKYKSLSDEPLKKWRETINNPFRKYFVKKYLIWLSDNKILKEKYKFDELIKELDKVPMKLNNVLIDIYRHFRGTISIFVNFHVFRSKRIMHNEEKNYKII